MKQFHSQLTAYFSHPIAWITGGILCCFLALGYNLSAQKNLSSLEQNARILKKKQLLIAQKTSQEKKLLQQLKIADRDYVENEVEQLQFLTPEIKKLQALLHTTPDDRTHAKRLQFLQSSKNKLRFREQNFRRANGHQEVDLIQDHPVEMNHKDLRTLIARIENQAIGDASPGRNPPNLLIKKFELTKKPLNSSEEVFVVNLELIKHEITHE